jgi:general secretion pathway protein L
VSASTPLFEFYDWWRGQLTSLWPESLARRATPRGQVARLRLDGQQIALYPPGSSTPVADDRPLPPGIETLELELAPNEFLLRHLTLPAAALSNLAEAVGYQIPRILPFTREQVLYACGSERPATAGDREVPVWVVAIPRRRLTEITHRLEFPLPDRPLSLRHPPAAGEPLRVSWRRAGRDERRQRRQRGLWLGLVVLWAAVLGMTLFKQQGAYDELAMQRDALRGDALAVGELRERMEHARALSTGLLERRQSAVPVLQLLNELTESLDDDTWLISLDLEDGELSLQGVSENPAALIETLEDATLLRDVRFESAITQAAGEGSRFNVSARIDTIAPGDLP